MDPEVVPPETLQHLGPQPEALAEARALQGDVGLDRDRPRAVRGDEAELAANPRARSAYLRVAVRTDAAPGQVDDRTLGLPQLPGGG